MQSACRRSAALGLLITLIAAGLAAAAAPPRYTLRLHQGKGDKAIYLFTSTATERLSGPGAPRGAITSRAQIACALEFRGTSPGGDIVVQGRVTGGRVKANVGGQSQADVATRSLASYVYTPRSEPRQSELVSGSLQRISAAGLMFALGDALLPLPLPDKPVAVGDRWQSSARIPAETGRAAEARDVKYDSKVLGQVTYAGRRCLKISTNGRESQRGTAEASDGRGTITLEAQITDEGTWLFDPKAGLVVKSDFSTTIALMRVRKMSGQQEQVSKGSSTLRTHVEMTAYNGREVAAK